jgi:hypothetical protein
MKKAISMLSMMMILTGIAQAAPYYTGPGCNEEGTSCLFGTDSGRVVEWRKKGTLDEMGQGCEKFINRIEERKNEILKSQHVVLKYRNFTARLMRDPQTRQIQDVQCKIELHSELPDVKFEHKMIKRFFWVCDDDSSGGICGARMKDCVATRDQALQDPEVLDATIYLDASLLQGRMCEVVTVKFKK